MATVDQYRDLLAEQGFTALQEQDMSDVFVDQYRRIYRRLARMEGELVGLYGRRVFDTVSAINGLVLEAFSNRVIGGRRFVANLDSD